MTVLAILLQRWCLGNNLTMLLFCSCVASSWRKGANLVRFAAGGGRGISIQCLLAGGWKQLVVYQSDPCAGLDIVAQHIFFLVTGSYLNNYRSSQLSCCENSVSCCFILLPASRAQTEILLQILHIFLLVFLIKKAERLTAGEKVPLLPIIWSTFLRLLSSIKLPFIDCTVAS